MKKSLTTLTAVLALAWTSHSQAAEPIWDGNKVEMVSEQLAPGAYAYYPQDAKDLNAKGAAAATSGGLIVGSKGALLIETMLNKRLHQQVMALNKKNQAKTITYAINTSAHGDHSYGNMYLPANTRIIQHANTRNYVSAHLEDDKAFMLKHFGNGRGIEEIQARTGDILVPAGGSVTVDLGGRSVDIIDFGFAQTGGDLFVWDPAAKVMWAGNAIIASKPALPWLLDGHLTQTLDTLNKVYAFLPADARIVPGHGVPMDREALKWHLDYLSAVKQNVQAAIDKGMTLEQTVKAVAMPEFGGYSLFGWVHPGLNVPAAYKDLSKAR
ncbi:MBL fold metallo-hydrolase [Chitinimonas arctica]|uniref:MBL fold metallo-hydrolase n=1 Tax=Chitinimonas arctica TaxID=2594795 RepID=A0A516SKD4_9NEIS|nr:MBL fold metallo-hydrolase [Chitinimonas arctica]QDQ28622.1 MBL fold metallo-hydrolase [Chitinimonas arctica]